MSLDLACGGVGVNERGEVPQREPSGHFGGYVWTRPKGRPDAGEVRKAAALLAQSHSPRGRKRDLEILAAEAVLEAP